MRQCGVSFDPRGEAESNEQVSLGELSKAWLRVALADCGVTHE